MSNPLSNSIDNLQTIIDQSTIILQSPNLSATEKAQIQGMLTSAHSALSGLLTSENNKNTAFGESYTQASEAMTFVNQAKSLLDNMYTDETAELNNLRTTNATQLKQIQFNNYFSQKYNYNVGIMKILVITSVLLMICIFLHTRNLIPSFLYTIILAIIIAVAVIIVFTMLISEVKRSNTNFNEFQWAPPKT